MANLTTNMASIAAAQGAIAAVNVAPDLGDFADRIDDIYGSFAGGSPSVWDTDQSTYILGSSGGVDFDLQGNFAFSSNGAVGTVTYMDLEDFSSNLEIFGAINLRVTTSSAAISGSVSAFVYDSGDLRFNLQVNAAVSLDGVATSFPMSSVSYTYNEDFIWSHDKVVVHYTGNLAYNHITGALTGTLNTASIIATDFDTRAVTTLNFTGLSHNVASLLDPSNGNLLPAATVLPMLLNGNDIINGTPAAETLSGYAGNDTINGLGGNDTLIGGIGDDTLRGGIGDDILRGADGADTLDGGAGNDDMQGGAGDDVYVVNAAGDTAIDTLSGGTDTVRAYASHTLGAYIENLVLLAGAAGTGNNLSNTITGNAAANTLDGGEGVDVLMGGLGDDTYIVDHTIEHVIEEAGGGTDTVRSSDTYWLFVDAANVENLTLTGSEDINGYGNALVNVITGNSGNNQLNGQGGVDTLIGGLGSDTYYVDSALEVVVEGVGDVANDTVITGFSVSLMTQYANVESVSLTGSANLNATGNAGVNFLSGNGGNNILNGGQGNDFMRGGLGHDTYYVHNAGDVVTEALNAGSDLVRAVVSYTLTANMEYLTLEGAGNLYGIGNGLSNGLTGNDGNNVLHGGGGDDNLHGDDGNDTLDGGMGFDILTGGVGNDIYRFSTAVDPASLPVGVASNVDWVNFAAGDSFLLYDEVFGSLNAGALAASSFVNGTTALDADDFILYNAATGELFYDADGNGAGVQLLFAELIGGPALSAADFNIV